MMRLAVVQQLPLEYYPPVTNLLAFLGESGDFEVRVFSVANTRGRPAWTRKGVRITTLPSPLPGDSALKRLFLQLRFVGSTWAGLLRFRPEAILYFEPHSALPVFCHHLSLFRRTRIFVHHHEYYEPQEFDRPGMRLPKLAHWCERTLLFADAEWISQTNEQRRELFLEDHPAIDPGKVRVMPNYPPRSWEATENRAWKDDAAPLRLVYIGSLSREDTYIEPLVEWVNATEHPVTLDIFGYNVSDSTRAWLESRAGDRVAFDPRGILYEDLPERIADYHAGVILYRGNTTNFVWNAPNKLFEYLACGLDAWYPPVMKGIAPYGDASTAPRILEVDFDRLDAIPFERLAQRGDIPHRGETHLAEPVQAALAEALLAI